VALPGIRPAPDGARPRRRSGAAGTAGARCPEHPPDAGTHDAIRRSQPDAFARGHCPRSRAACLRRRGDPDADARRLEPLYRRTRPPDGGGLVRAELAGGAASHRPHRGHQPELWQHPGAALLCLCELWLPVDDRGTLRRCPLGVSAGSGGAPRRRGGQHGVEPPRTLLLIAHCRAQPHVNGCSAHRHALPHHDRPARDGHHLRRAAG